MAGAGAQDGGGASSWGLRVPWRSWRPSPNCLPTLPSGRPPVDFLGLTAPLLSDPPTRTATGSLEEAP